MPLRSLRLERVLEHGSSAREDFRLWDTICLAGVMDGSRGTGAGLDCGLGAGGRLRGGARDRHGGHEAVEVRLGHRGLGEGMQRSGVAASPDVALGGRRILLERLVGAQGRRAAVAQALGAGLALAAFSIDLSKLQQMWESARDPDRGMSSAASTASWKSRVGFCSMAGSLRQHAPSPQQATVGAGSHPPPMRLTGPWRSELSAWVWGI